MASVKELGYVIIEASDLDAWKEFAVDILGMGVGSETPGQSLGLRFDDRVHRLLITNGPADDMVAIGYDCGDEGTLDEIVARLRQDGLAVEDCEPQLAASRKVKRLAATQDPAGNRVELYVDLTRADDAFVSNLVPSGFCTGSGGAGHAFLPAPDREAMADFYSKIGFLLSDYIVQELAPGVVVDAAFMHCNPRHHTVAFADMPSAKKMHHFMMEVNDRVDVGRAYDRVLNAKLPLALSLGMHPNDHMFSFYVVTPSGFAIEFGAEGRLIENEKAWEVTTYDRLSIWGHRPPEHA